MGNKHSIVEKKVINEYSDLTEKQLLEIIKKQIDSWIDIHPESRTIHINGPVMWEYLRRNKAEDDYFHTKTLCEMIDTYNRPYLTSITPFYYCIQFVRFPKSDAQSTNSCQSKAVEVRQHHLDQVGEYSS